MPPSPKIEFSGVLTRYTFSDGQAEIRISPFTSSLDPDEKPVWSLVFEKPDFDVAAVQSLLDDEVDIQVFDRHAGFYCLYNQLDQTLSATKLTARMVGYDVVDLALYARKLEENVRRLDDKLRSARAKDDQGRVLLRELLRRAEIKAAACDHHRQRQAAAEVLKRLLTHYDV